MANDAYLIVEIIDSTTGEIELREPIGEHDDLVAYSAEHTETCMAIHNQGHHWVLQIIDPDTDEVLFRSSSDPEQLTTPVAITSKLGQRMLRRMAAPQN